jgi:transcriptional regulator with XRE-family HTH domain
MNRLEAALEHRGMTVAQLSRASRIREATLRLWLSGQSEPRLSNLKALCRGLRVSADYLAGLTDEIEGTPGR